MNEHTEKDLEGKIALITGAGRGIGAATAEFLADHGAAIVVADVNLDAAKKQAQKMEQDGYTVHAAHVDVTSSASVYNLVSETMDTFGKIDILVNNAGIANFKKLPEVTEEEWDKVINVNLKGTQLCSAAVFNIMMEQRSGKIVNLASMGGQLGGLKVAPDYVASKAGVIGLTKSYAKYGAQYGINVNAVSPGPTATDMAGDHFDPSMIPLGRLGTPLDIAKAIYFLASSLSDYITGATIDINGGVLMR